MNLAGDRHTGDGSPDGADQVDEENSDADDVRDRSGDDAMDDAGAPPPDQPAHPGPNRRDTVSGQQQDIRAYLDSGYQNARNPDILCDNGVAGQQGDVLQIKKIGEFRVGTLNVKGCFGKQNFVGAPHVMGVVLGKFCKRWQLDVLAVQDLNMTSGRELMAQKGLRATGYFGDFCYDKDPKTTAAKRDNTRGGVGFIIARRHLQNRQADSKELRSKDRRAYAIRLRLHDGRIWALAVLYGEPNPGATDKREACAALNKWALNLKDLCEKEDWPLILLGDFNTIQDNTVDVWGSTRPALREGPARALIDGGYFDLFRHCNHTGRAWTFVNITKPERSCHRLDHALGNAAAAAFVSQATHETASTPSIGLDHAAVIITLSGLKDSDGQICQQAEYIEGQREKAIRYRFLSDTMPSEDSGKLASTGVDQD